MVSPVRRLRSPNEKQPRIPLSGTDHTDETFASSVETLGCDISSLPDSANRRRFRVPGGRRLVAIDSVFTNNKLRELRNIATVCGSETV